MNIAALTVYSGISTFSLDNLSNLWTYRSIYFAFIFIIAFEYYLTIHKSEVITPIKPTKENVDSFPSPWLCRVSQKI